MDGRANAQRGDLSAAAFDALTKRSQLFESLRKFSKAHAAFRD
jgi:hypothetical protein